MQETGFIKSFNDDEITIRLKDLSENQRYMITNAIGSQSTMYFDDGRHITVDQRKKIFALFNEIAEYLGYTQVNVEEILKIKFLEQMDNPVWFSFSNCSIEIAKQFLEFEITFCIQNEIPFKTKLMDEIQQSYALRYQLVMHRICFVCGKLHAELDHVDTIGSGRNRRHVNQIGYEAWTLCRNHHNERHKIGVETFATKYQVKPIKLNEEIINKLNLADKGAIKDE
ncbi:putative HNHc nuclease [Apilactobacillus sp. EABW-1NA]|uniref:putative HNHc nuclease n=1 Tax=Apilactobacillus sp. EABW-1NA TaxID=2984137 RepID=UPI0025B0E3D8|nr:putative HNHc nuclease [Apilactobacillus sp. EABW-1NA]MDN2613316.1 putative HNHc nuclease [Apilactobacillus sp. EABW-1NA]